MPFALAKMILLEQTKSAMHEGNFCIGLIYLKNAQAHGKMLAIFDMAVTFAESLRMLRKVKKDRLRGLLRRGRKMSIIYFSLNLYF